MSCWCNRGVGACRSNSRCVSAPVDRFEAGVKQQKLKCLSLVELTVNRIASQPCNSIEVI